MRKLDHNTLMRPYDDNARHDYKFHGRPDISTSVATLVEIVSTVAIMIAPFNLGIPLTTISRSKIIDFSLMGT